ncbi:MAG: efflux transporter outer membrane subunit [Gammaproteobacteria bacterium]|nr:efflux transporter outer membrane subunit [Gammaproteobacteria bacterium]
MTYVLDNPLRQLERRVDKGALRRTCSIAGNVQGDVPTIASSDRWTRRQKAPNNRQHQSQAPLSTLRLLIINSIVPLLSLCFIISSLTGCTRYVRPDTPIPSNWTTGGEAPLTPTDETAWWRHFNDPILTKLIEQKSVYNLNLKMAQARVETARSQFAIATAQLFPSAAFTALPPNGTGFNLTQLFALNTVFDPDIFGKLKQVRRSAKAALEAEEAVRDFTILSLYVEIATSYLELREAQARDTILQGNLEGNKQILSFLNERYKAGFSSYINIAQQDALVETQLAEWELNKASVTAVLNKIEVLTGKNPGELTNLLRPVKPVPQITQPINLGVPGELLSRRSDIMAAERRVAATHENIGVAITSLFPQANLGWLLGWQTETITSIIALVQNPESSFFATLNAPIFNLGLYNNISLKKREKIVAVIQYRDIVLRALHEVEVQYSYCVHNKVGADHFKHAVDQKRIVLKLAKEAYQKGLSDFSTVLRSEEDLNRLEMAYLHNIVSYQTARINLYKALGGNLPQVKTKKKDRRH